MLHSSNAWSIFNRYSWSALYRRQQGASPDGRGAPGGITVTAQESDIATQRPGRRNRLSENPSASAATAGDYTYGHKAGDKALKLIAFVLQQTVRETDYIARYGGEEFVAIIPD